MSHYNLRKTESSLNIRGGIDKKNLPIWDSSDPSRNPPPMPINPDSPSLNPVSSPSRLGFGSPTRGFGTKTLGSMGDEKIIELIYLTKQIKESQTVVEKSVNEALMEFGGLANRSRDNAAALSLLKEKVVKTEDYVYSTKTNIEDGLADMKTSMDSQKDSRKAFTTVADSLLDSTKSVVTMLQTHERYLKDISKTTTASSNTLEKSVASKEAPLTKYDMKEMISSISKQATDHHAQLEKSISKIRLNLPQRTSEDTDSTSKVLARIDFHSEASEKNSKRSIAQILDKIESVSQFQTDSLGTILKNLENQNFSSHDSTKIEVQIKDILEKLDAVSKNVDGSGNHNETAEQTQIYFKSELSSYRSYTQKDLNGHHLKIQTDIAKNLQEHNSTMEENLRTHHASISKNIDKLVTGAGAQQLDQIKKLQSVVNSLAAENSLGELLKQSKEDAKIVLDSNKEYGEKVLKMIEGQSDSKNIEQLMKSLADLSDKTHIEKISQLDRQYVAQLVKSLSSKMETLVTAEQYQTGFDKFDKDMDSKLANNHSKSSKVVSELQADVRSLIDLQYSDMGKFTNAVKGIELQLQKLESNDAEVKLQARVAELEKQLKERDSKDLQNAANATIANYQQSIIDQRMKLIEELDNKIDNLRTVKETISTDVHSMKLEIRLRLEEFDKLETRIAGFEQRMSESILDRSRNILGSTTLSIINNQAGTPQQRPLSNNSPIKRNLSLAPADLSNDENEDPDTAVDRLLIAKSRFGTSPASPLKNRSISMYTG